MGASLYGSWLFAYILYLFQNLQHTQKEKREEIEKKVNTNTSATKNEWKRFIMKYCGCWEKFCRVWKVCSVCIRTVYVSFVRCFRSFVHLFSTYHSKHVQLLYRDLHVSACTYICPSRQLLPFVWANRMWSLHLFPLLPTHRRVANRSLFPVLRCARSVVCAGGSFWRPRLKRE